MIDKFKEYKIKYLCNVYGIENYTINDDMSIDVNEHTFINDFKMGKSKIFKYKYFKKIPLNFNNIYGVFRYARKGLQSLNGFPNYVENTFELSSIHNKIDSFKNMPRYIGGDLDLSYTKIRSFKYFPEVKGGVGLRNNPITELWYLFHNTDHIEYFNELDIITEDESSIILERLNYFLVDIGKKELNYPKFQNYKVI